MENSIRTLELIERIYDATAGLGNWEHVVEGLSQLFDGASAVLHVKRPSDTRPPHRFAAGPEPGAAIRYSHEFLESVAASNAALHRVRAGFAPAAEAGEGRSLGHYVAAAGSEPIVAWLLFRGADGAPFSPDELQLLARIAPHLKRAFEMTERFTSTTRERIALVEVMDRLPVGVLLLDANARVRFRNHCAQHILARADAFEIRDDKLRVDDPEANAELQDFIAEALGAPAGASGGGATIAPRSTEGVPYPVSVSRLLPGEPTSVGVAAVLINDPDTRSEPAAELMRSLHGLTAAETDLVGILARGHSLEEAARQRGVSIHTVRSQLKQVFQKTGTSRQGDLMQLVLRCFIPLVNE